MSAHTVGPWMITECAGRRDIEITSQKRIDTGMADICEMDIHFDGKAGEEQRANATLIAAAPDLLSGCNALLGLLTLISGRRDCPPEIAAALRASHRIDEANEAITKATQS